MNKNQQKAIKLLSERTPKSLGTLAMLLPSMELDEIVQVLLVVFDLHWAMTHQIEDNHFIKSTFELPNAYFIEVKMYYDEDDDIHYFEVGFYRHEDAKYYIQYTDRHGSFQLESYFVRREPPKKKILKIFQGVLN